MKLANAAVAVLVVACLAGCSSDADDESGAPSATPTTSPTSTPTTTPTPAGRVVAQENGGSFCVDDLHRGDLVAFTGPKLLVEDGPVTISGARSGDLRLRNVRAVQFTPGGVREPMFIVADTIDELKPEGKPYVEDSEGPLVGETFDEGTGVVPLLEARLAWPAAQQGVDLVDVFVDQPPLTVTWTSGDGDEQTLEVPMPVELHSLAKGCKN